MRTATTKSDRIKKLVGSQFFTLNVQRGKNVTPMHCRMNVNTWGDLEVSTPRPRKGYLTVFDVRNKKYTGVNENTIKSVTFKGRTRAYRS